MQVQAGVGTAAIQLAKQADAAIFVTASASKQDFCLQLGAHHAIDYKKENFETVILEKANGKRGECWYLILLVRLIFDKNLNTRMDASYRWQ